MNVQTLHHELIRASAGTGKTFALTTRYLRLLQMGQQPDDILAATFTRKAAGEILGRVLLRLAQAATNPEKLGELQEALGDTSLSCPQCMSLLVHTSRRLHRLRIGTLDSFFAKLASSFALEIGLPPGWRIVEEHEDAVLRARAIEAMLDQEDPDRLLTLVHALTRGETTRSLDREVRDKVEMLYSVYRESSRDSWYRAPRMCELSHERLSAAIEALRSTPIPADARWRKAHDRSVERAEAGDWAGFISNGIAAKIAAADNSYFGKPIDTALAEAYQLLIDHTKGVLLNQVANQTEATHQLLESFHTHYQQLKSQNRALRFEDITFQLAERSPAVTPSQRADTDPLAFRLDAHLRHLLLDEFQDTSLAQWAVIRPLARRITRAETGQSFFCVGDVKQAIYGWRGGVAEIFDAVARELDNIEQQPRDTNWRSSPRIIETVNRIFPNLHRHGNLGDLAGAVARWQRQFNEHHTAGPKKGLNGYVCLQAAESDGRHENESTNDMTLRFAAEQVAQWKRQAPGFDIGVLVRRNTAVRRLIYELRELGVEASEEGGSSLDDSAAVRLIMSLFHLADHPADSVARFHLATSPLAGTIGLIDEEGPCDAVRGGSDDKVDFAQWFAGPRGDAAAGRLARQIRRRLVDDGYGPTVYALACQLACSCNRRELRRLEKLIGLAYRYADSATSRPGDFVAYVDAAKVRDPIAADVRVMTVHQAKGLEFDIVVLADLEAQLIGQRDDLVVARPSATEPIDRVCRRCNKEVQQLMPESWRVLFRDADDEDVAEALCVLYVSVTRAIHALHMIVAPSADNERRLRKTYGGLLRAALKDNGQLAPGDIAYETGDRQWFKSPGVQRALSSAQVAAQAESLTPLEVQLAAPAPRRARGLQRVTPSDLEGGTHVRLPAESRGSPIDRAAALARGTLIHAWFEQIEWLDDGPPADARLREVAATLPDLAFTPEDVDRMLAEFRTMLARPAVASCLQRRAYHRFGSAELKVETERPIAVRRDDRLMVGNVDRMVTVYRGDQPIAVDIVDFKTDRIPPHDKAAVEERVEFYRPQAAAYRNCVSAISRLESQHVSATLLFVEPGIAENV